MSEQKTISPEALWAYVHGEMGDAERSAVKQELDRNPDLRREYENISRMHSSVAQLAPLAGASQEELADRIMDAIDTPPVLQVVRETEQTVQPESSTVLDWFVNPRFTFWSSSLAAAAAVVFVLASLPAYLNGNISWARPEIVETQYRGASGSSKPAQYDRIDAARCLSELKRSVHDAYVGQRRAEPGLSKVPSWRPGFRFQELADGRFSIEVRIFNKNDQEIDVWEKEFADAESFLKEAEASGTAIVERSQSALRS